MQLELFSVENYTVLHGRQIRAPWGTCYQLLQGKQGSWWAISQYGHLFPADPNYLMNEAGFVLQSNIA